MIATVPFADEHVDAAAALLAARQGLDRAREPALPTAAEDPAIARRALEAVLAESGALGMAALRDGDLAGFLLANLRLGEPWGRAGWMPYAGHALAPGESAALMGDLYGALAPALLERWAPDHYALVPASDGELVEAWFGLGFGKMQVHAVADTGGEGFAAEGVTLRRATPDDAHQIAELAPLIAQHQAASPTFAPLAPESRAGLVEGYVESLGEDDVTIWVGEREGRLLGLSLLYPTEAEEVDLLSPERCVSLAVASTRPEARGLGVGRALVDRSLAWAREEGYERCLADWRSTNLLSSRFWPQRGFRPIAYRLYRHVDPRAAWVNAT